MVFKDFLDVVSEYDRFEVVDGASTFIINRFSIFSMESVFSSLYDRVICLIALSAESVPCVYLEKDGD